MTTTSFKVIDGIVYKQSAMNWTPLESIDKVSRLGAELNASLENSRLLNSIIQEKVTSPEMTEAYYEALDLINWYAIHSDENLHVIRELLIGLGSIIGM